MTSVRGLTGGLKGAFRGRGLRLCTSATQTSAGRKARGRSGQPVSVKAYTITLVTPDGEETLEVRQRERERERTQRASPAASDELTRRSSCFSATETRTFSTPPRRQESSSPGLAVPVLAPRAPRRVTTRITGTRATRPSSATPRSSRATCSRAWRIPPRTPRSSRTPRRSSTERRSTRVGIAASRARIQDQARAEGRRRRRESSGVTLVQLSLLLKFSLTLAAERLWFSC